MRKERSETKGKRKVKWTAGDDDRCTDGGDTPGKEPLHFRASEPINATNGYQ